MNRVDYFMTKYKRLTFIKKIKLSVIGFDWYRFEMTWL